MAVSAIVAGAVGAGMVAGGTAAAVKSMKQKTKGRRAHYGGNADATQGYRETYAGGVDKGATGVNRGTVGLVQAGQQAGDIRDRGLSIMDSAGGVSVSPNAFTREGAGILGAYQPGAVSAAQAQQMLERNARANLGAAQGGGAMAMRNAVNANAYAGVNAAADIAAIRAGEEERLMAAKVAQANADQQTVLGAEALADQQALQRLQLGSGVASGGNQQAIGTSGAIGQLGLAQEKTYVDALQNVETQQLMANMDYEKRRQADAQRKANNLWNLGSTLIGGGAKMAAGAGGGG